MEATARRNRVDFIGRRVSVSHSTPSTATHGGGEVCSGLRLLTVVDSNLHSWFFVRSSGFEPVRVREITNPISDARGDAFASRLRNQSLESKRPPSAARLRTKE